MPAPYCGCWGAAGGQETSERGEPRPPMPDASGALWGSSPPPRYTCRCAEDLHEYEWRWEPNSRATNDAAFGECRREVTFHKVHSSGTAVIRGDRTLVNDRVYYWEIKILTALYGTDVMIGVGSHEVDVDTSRYEFTSFLGLDAESYGLSYTGRVQHAGEKKQYCEGFGKGVIVGVRLDMWHGTLEYFLNRQPMGIAFTGLKRHPRLYPMMSSTASQSAVRLIYSMSLPASLVLHSARSLSDDRSAFQRLHKIPGLKSYFERVFWILLPSYSSDEEESFGNRERSGVLKNHFKSGPKKVDPISYPQCSLRQCCATKLLSNLCSNISNEESCSTRDHMDIDLWDAALENLTGDGDPPDRIPQEHAVKFSPMIPPVICQSCKQRTAVVTVLQTQLKQCRECFHSS